MAKKKTTQRTHAEIFYTWQNLKGGELRKMIKEFGYQQKEVAAKFGVHVTTLNRMLSIHRSIPRKYYPIIVEMMPPPPVVEQENKKGD